MAMAAYTSAYSAAADTDQREDGRSHPTLTAWWIPTALRGGEHPVDRQPQDVHVGVRVEATRIRQRRALRISRGQR